MYHFRSDAFESNEYILSNLVLPTKSRSAFVHGEIVRKKNYSKGKISTNIYKKK